MSQLIIGLFFLFLFLAFWAGTGHAIWLVFSFFLRQASKKTCPECNDALADDDKACRKCGWTSRAINRAAAMRVCHQALNAALKRGLIDQEAFDRGIKTVSDLERSLAGKIPQAPILAAQSAPPTDVPGSLNAAQPNVPSDSMVEATLVEATLVPSAAVIGSPNSVVVQPTLPITKDQADLPPVLVAAKAIPQPHALDQEYAKPPIATEPQLSRIKKTWGKWLSAFMEEKNIQWGELAGGILILCCSTALVVSFWEHIASRPWLKFCIFTGINAATLGLGLNAWHRWKLPTTSRGILMIGLLLLPLNFLAFAIFTLGIPFDWWTVLGESLSLVLLGCLAWFAAKVVTPRAETITTITIVGFAIANLVVRRTVGAESSTTVLYASASALIGFFVAMMLLGKYLLHKSEQHDASSLLRLLGLGSFGLLIAFGFLLGCSGNATQSIHLLSPLLSLFAFPILVSSMAIGKQASAKSQLLLLSLILAAFAFAISSLGVVLAWPMPLLIIACLAGLSLLVAIVAQAFPQPQIGYAWYLIGGCVAALAWHVAIGHVGLRNDEWRLLLRAMGTADTGFAIVAWSVLCLGASILLSKRERAEHSLVALRSAGLNGIVGTGILTVFGLGRHEYAVSVALIYLLYGIAMIVIATLRRRRYLDGIAGAFVVAACFQGIAFGWLQGTGWMAPIYWSLTAAAIIIIAAVAIRKWIGVEPFAAPKPLDDWYRGLAALAVIVAGLWLAISESGTALPGARLLEVKELVLLTAVWIAIACLQRKAMDWTIAQLIGTAAGMLWIHHHAKLQDWYIANGAGFLHPYSVQMHLAWFAIFATVSCLIMAFANRWIRTMGIRTTGNRTGENGTTQIENVGPPKSVQAIRQFIALHEYSIAPGLIQIAVVCFIALAYYGATPGSIQELMPVDGMEEKQSVAFEVDGKSVTRVIPDIAKLEFAVIPHQAAGWNSESVAMGFAGLPRMFWLWCLLCASLTICFSEKPGRWQVSALISCALAIALPIASRWESEVAVASACRWALSFVYAVGCVLLCVWYAYRNAPQEADEARMAGRFDACFSTLLANIIVPLALMGAIVIGGAVSHFSFAPWDVTIWMAFGFMALAGSAIWLMTMRMDRQSIGAKYGIAGFVLLISPFLAWFVLQIVLVLVQHPLTGPNANSLFVRMGLATSYTIPIFIFAVGLVAISVVRRSPGIAFSACLVLLLTGLAGFMLALKSEGLKPSAWVGLLATLTIISGTFTLVWNWYSRSNSLGWFPHVRAEPHLERDRAFWQNCLRQIAIGFVSASVCLTAVLLIRNGLVIDRLEFFSIAAVAAVFVVFAAHWYASKEVVLHWCLVAVAFLAAGFAAAMSSNLTTAIIAPCVVLISAGAILAWRTASKSASVGLLTALSLPLVQCFLLALRILLIGKTEHFSVAMILAVTFIALFIAWRSGRFSFAVGAIVSAHVAGLVHTFSSWGGANFSEHMTNTFLMQISVAALMSFLCSLIGFAGRMRYLHAAAVFLLAFMSTSWYLRSLDHTVNAFSLSYYALAVAACTFGSVARYWLRTSSHTDFLVYVSALSSVVLFFQTLNPGPMELQRISTLGFAAFCLASSFVWRASDRIRATVNGLRIFPTLEARSGSIVVIVANTVLAFGVAVLGIWAQFQCESLPLRLASSQAIMAVAFAVGLLARYKEISSSNAKTLTSDDGSLVMRVIALSLGVCAAVAFGWHFDSIDTIIGLNRLSYASLSLAIMALVYGFGLIKYVGLSDRWCQAALMLMPTLVGATAAAVGVVLYWEWSLGPVGLEATISFAAIVCIIVAIIASMVACMAAALISGSDPFGLSERGRTVYVWVTEALLVMMVMHLRLTMPWLFGGWVQAVWPLLIVGLAFVGLGVSEWAKRNKLGVLADPLERTGMMLPLLPLLTHWIVPSQVHYGVSLLCASVAYASFGYLRKSMLYWGASVITGNAALWFALHSTDFQFTQHPQLWVIPPALSLLAIVQILKERLPREQVVAGRYLATSSIYVASTAEVFIQGIAEAPWLPIVLAGLSIAGIISGIALRIRAMLWLGSMFLCVAMFTVIWHAAVDLEQTWVWYVSGIVMGVLILTMFALFEKRREQMKGLVSKLQEWDD